MKNIKTLPILVFSAACSGCIFSPGVSERSSKLSHDINIELIEPSYAVRYQVEEGAVTDFYVIDVYGKGKSLAYHLDQGGWTARLATDIDHYCIDGRLIMFACGAYERPVSIIGNWDEGIGDDGNKYSFRLDGGFNNDEYAHAIHNAFGNSVRVEIANVEIPWARRSRSALWINRLNYLWSVPADAILTPIAIILSPILPRFG